MKKMLKRLCTGFLALATVVTALPTTPVHAESKQYWTESAERVGIVEKVMNDGSIGSTFNEGHLTVEGEDAYCIDINTDFIFIAFSCYFRYLLSYQLNNTKEKRVLEKRGVLMDLTILVVGLILGVGIPLRNKAIKKRRENMKEKGNEEK